MVNLSTQEVLMLTSLLMLQALHGGPKTRTLSYPDADKKCVQSPKPT